MHVNILASAEDQECGINHYTTSLESSLSISNTRTGIKSYSTDVSHYIKKGWSSVKSDADIIHLQHEYGVFGPGSICSWPVIILLILGSTFLDKKIVVTFHNVWNKETFGPPFWFLKRFYIWMNNKLLIYASDHIIVLSENSEDKLVSMYGIQNYTRIPHGVQVDTCNLTKDEARSLLGWERQADTVVLPGYIRRHKGHDRFVEIACADPHREYIIAGGVRNDIFEGYAEELSSKSPDNMKITGVLDDTEFGAVFAAADLCYLPYRDASGQSGIANWSFAHGLPIFGSNIDYFQELEDQTDGVKVVGTSTETVIAEIDAYFDDEDHRRYMARAATKYAEENSIERVAQEHINIYNSLLEE